MFLAHDELRRITQDIWWNLLEMDLASAPLPPGNGEELATGRVVILGDWCGEVTVQCTSRLARHAAARMFGTTPELVPDADVLDTVGELANITGGNVKTLFAGPSRLSLPSATFERAARHDPADVIERIACRYEDELLLVSVREGGSDRVTRQPGVEVGS